jgi:sugar transferase (PEP-CTERM/EpsH1 system associated)
MARVLAERAQVQVVSLVHDRDEADQADTLRALGIDVTTHLVPRARNLVNGLVTLASARPLTHALLDAPDVTATLARVAQAWPPDVVFAYCSGMARFALQSPIARWPFVLDFVDLDSGKWQALSATTTGPKRWIYAREARCLAKFEKHAALTARSALVVNDREGAALKLLAPGANIHVVPNGIDVDAFQPSGPACDQPRAVFCGVMNYQPNVEAAVWFSKRVWPLVIAERPDARLAIVGSSPAPEVVALARDESTIHVTGTVADVRPHLWNAAVSVAPLLTARGIQNKVLEAVAAGLPAVVTPAVFAGLPPEVEPACLVADDPTAFAARVLGLFGRSALERRAMAGAANLRVLGWDRQLEPLVNILADAARTHLASASNDSVAAGTTVNARRPTTGAPPAYQSLGAGLVNREGASE